MKRSGFIWSLGLLLCFSVAYAEGYDQTLFYAQKIQNGKGVKKRTWGNQKGKFAAFVITPEGIEKPEFGALSEEDKEEEVVIALAIGGVDEGSSFVEYFTCQSSEVTILNVYYYESLKKLSTFAMGPGNFDEYDVREASDVLNPKRAGAQSYSYPFAYPVSKEVKDFISFLNQVFGQSAVNSLFALAQENCPAL